MLKNIRQQGENYWLVLKWLITSYYSQEKRSFWLVQLLMGLSIVTGLAWLLGLMAGLSYLNDSQTLAKYPIPFLVQFFSLPLWLWVMVLSISGLASALLQFVSFKVGVNSVIRYQKEVLLNGLEILNNNKVEWASNIQDSPKLHINRVLKTGVQLLGLVVRRLVRIAVPICTFIVAVISLYYLNAALLSLMIPLAVLFVIALYFINRMAARNQVKLVGLGKIASFKLGAIIDESLSDSDLPYDLLKRKVDESFYEKFSLFRYKRRLAEIHVAWLNSLFLVLGSALIIFSEGVNTGASGVNWTQLILFIVALRYAGSGLQEIASSTVAFSRFLPETELVYQLINAKRIEASKADGLVYALNVMAVPDGLFKKLVSQKFQVSIWHSVEDMGSSDIINKSLPETCVISKSPVKFKQAVRKENKAISLVVILDEKGELVDFEVDQFLLTFDPQQAIQAKKNKSNWDDDTEEEI